MVIGKTGYSTISEAFHAGIPFGYINRPNFRESGILSEFIKKEICGFEIDGPDFYQGNWTSKLDYFMKKHKLQRKVTNGADEIAEYVLKLF